MTEKSSKQLTKEKIINAAGEVFAERGFHSATIREITTRADVNVAAINYYFRDKEELYNDVLREAKCNRAESFSQVIEGTPEERLRKFVHRLTHHLLDPAKPSWHIRVMTQEVLNPTRALDMIVKEHIAPLTDELGLIVGDIVGTKLPNQQLHLQVISIMGQCLMHRRSRSVIERLAPEIVQDPHSIDLIANHITDFSLAALRGQYPSNPAPQPLP